MTDELEREISHAVAQEIASARRVVLGANPRHQSDLFKRCAVDLWRIVKVDATIYPDGAAAANLAAADALYDIGSSIGLDDDTEQRIIAAALEASDQPQINGRAVANEPSPVTNPHDYGEAPQPRLIDLTNVPLLIGEWLERDLPDPDFLVGQVLSTTSRIIINAETGLGKTNFVLAAFAHIGAGRDFLHWRCPRPRSVLFVDGEMSRRLLKQRAEDAVRRLGVVPGKLHLLSKEDVEGFPPLNSEAGRNALNAVIERIEQRSGEHLDAIGFDNIMSLLVGEMKEEQPWQQALPLVWDLTRRNIGQVWVHHTGHDVSHGYGTKTREWGMDTVMHLTEAKRPDADVNFVLKFAKARERTPLNRRDFQEVTIALVNDEWVCSAAIDTKKPPSPTGHKFLLALRNVFACGETVPYESWKATRLDRWQAECTRIGLIEDGNGNSARALFSKYRRELIERNHIACDAGLVWLR